MYSQESTPPSAAVDLPTLLVDVVTAEVGAYNVIVSANGSAIPRTETTIVSEVAGLITEVSPAFVAGGIFDAGDVLVRIDDRNYQADVKRAQAQVAAAETNVTREAGLADYAREDWERARGLLNSDRDASDLALRKPQLTEAIANLEFAQADLTKRLGDLDRTVIRAPYDGLVRDKRADVGQFVAAGTPLATTFSVDVAEIRLPIPDRELPFLDLSDDALARGEGPMVTLTADIGGTDHAWSGRIVRTEGVFDNRSRVLYVVAQVDDPYNQREARWPYPLRIGTFVEATIEGRYLANVIRLPRNVLAGDNRVWTVVAERLQPVAVDVVRADENWVYIGGGIDAGQLVCLSILDNPLPGTPVRYAGQNVMAELNLE